MPRLRVLTRGRGRGQDAGAGGGDALSTSNAIRTTSLLPSRDLLTSSSRHLHVSSPAHPEASPDTRVVTSVALLKWAIGNGWAWPTTDKDGHVDRFAACNLAAEGGCLLRPYNTLVPTAAAKCWPFLTLRRFGRVIPRHVRRRGEARAPQATEVAPRQRVFV